MIVENVWEFKEGRWIGMKFQAEISGSITEYIYAGSWKRLRKKLAKYDMILPDKPPMRNPIMVGVWEVYKKGSK